MKRSEGTARAISQFIDPSLDWKRIAWLKTITNLPIVLKGVQCYEDALLAVEAGCQGIVCSNHGAPRICFVHAVSACLHFFMHLCRARIARFVNCAMPSSSFPHPNHTQTSTHRQARTNNHTQTTHKQPHFLPIQVHTHLMSAP